MKRLWSIAVGLCLAANASWAMAQTGGGAAGSSSSGSGSTAGSSAGSTAPSSGITTGPRTTTAPGSTGVSPQVGSTQPSPGGTTGSTGTIGPGSQTTTTGTANQPGATGLNTPGTINNPITTNRLPGSNQTVGTAGNSPSRPGNNLIPPPSIGGTSPINEPSLPPAPVGRPAAGINSPVTNTQPGVAGAPPNQGSTGTITQPGSASPYTQPRTGGVTPGGTLTPSNGGNVGNSRGAPAGTRQPGTGGDSTLPPPSSDRSLRER